MNEKKFITQEEQAKCRQVADAFAELYAEEDIIALDAGIYGFVVLHYYDPEKGFENVDTFMDSRSLFAHLWDEWLNAQLFTLSKGTPMRDMLFEDMLNGIQAEKRQELMAKQHYFAEKTGIQNII